MIHNRAIFKWTLRSRLQGFKAVSVICLLPSLIALAAAHAGVEDPLAAFGEFIAPICLYLVLPLACMVNQLPTMTELYETGNLNYFWTRPSSRTSILVSMYNGATLAFLPFAILAAVLPAVILYFWGLKEGIPAPEHRIQDWLPVVGGLTGVLVMGCASYGSICMFFAVWSKRAILWSVASLIGWGTIVGTLPGDLRATSPHRYLFALLRDWTGLNNSWSGFTVPDPSPPTMLMSLVVLLAIVPAFLFFATQAAKRRDVF
ncbi:MAG: hypothetical protein MK213_00380 [Planctomycetes bacterium]|nr:hypothetical protein [Planctomycetota bacterium]